MRNSRCVLCALLLCVLFSTSACAEEKKEEVRTVEWYLEPENEAALKAKLAECNNNPGQLKDTPNCINAANANHKLWARKPAPTNW